MFQPIYELRKNWRGRDGTGGRTNEGSIRGPRGPKKWLVGGFGLGRSVEVFDQSFPGTLFNLVYFLVYPGILSIYTYPMFN